MMVLTGAFPAGALQRPARLSTKLHKVAQRCPQADKKNEAAGYPNNAFRVARNYSRIRKI
jgi:hypothetical protein